MHKQWIPGPFLPTKGPGDEASSTSRHSNQSGHGLTTSFDDEVSQYYAHEDRIIRMQNGNRKAILHSSDMNLAKASALCTRRETSPHALTLQLLTQYNNHNQY